MQKKIQAKTVKPGFWLLTQQGQKIANLVAVSGGLELRSSARRQQFPSLSEFQNRYEVEFHDTTPASAPSTQEVLGYPTSVPPCQAVFDVRLQLPTFTTHPESQCRYAAGYYVMQDRRGQWQVVWCPRVRDLNRRYSYGPFHTQEQAQEFWDQETQDDS